MMRTRGYCVALSLAILLLAACSTTPAPATPIPSATSAPVAVIPSATSLPASTTLPTAEPTNAPEPTAAPAPPAPILLKSGLFGAGTDGSSAVGTATLVQQPDGTVLLQFNEFQTQWGPICLFTYRAVPTHYLAQS